MNDFATYHAARWPGSTRSAAKPYWNPYVAGVVLGLVLLATYVVAGRGLGATGAFSALVAAIAQAVAPDAAQANPVHARYLGEGAPLLDFLPMLVLGVFLVVLGVIVGSIGLIGEIIIFLQGREFRDYHVDRVISGGSERRSG